MLQKCVKDMNKIAAGIGVDRAATNAGKAKVEKIIEAVRQHVECSGRTSEADEDVWEQATASYHGTWPEQCASEVPELQNFFRSTEVIDSPSPQNQSWKVC